MGRSILPRLLEVAGRHNGIVSAAQARAAGIPANTLVRLAERGTLERIARGVYRLPIFPVAAAKYAELETAIAWASANNGPQAVLSHESALAHFGISDALPDKIHLTVDPKSRIRRSIPKLYALHRESLVPADRTSHEGLPITTVERTIRDVARSGRNDLALAAISDASRLGFLQGSVEARLRSEIAHA